MRFFQFSSREKKRTPGVSRGFSLLETLLAIFIFGLVMTSVTMYFANISKANRNSKLLQQNLEDTQFAMNRIAKVLRTSAVVDPPPIASNGIQSRTEIRAYDFSQSLCIEYKFFGNEMIERISSDTFSSGNVLEWCEDPLRNFGADQKLVSADNGASLSGTFAVVPSNDSPPIAGRVTMNVTITRGNLSSTAQTSVSLRNYKELAP